MGRRTKMNKSMKRRLREEVAFDGMEQQAALKEAQKGRAARDAKHVSKALRRKNRRDVKDGIVVGKSDESSWFKVRRILVSALLVVVTTSLLLVFYNVNFVH